MLTILGAKIQIIIEKKNVHSSNCDFNAMKRSGNKLANIKGSSYIVMWQAFFKPLRVRFTLTYSKFDINLIYCK